LLVDVDDLVFMEEEKELYQYAARDKRLRPFPAIDDAKAIPLELRKTLADQYKGAVTNRMGRLGDNVPASV
jgi:hypothetical protein